MMKTIVHHKLFLIATWMLGLPDIVNDYNTGGTTVGFDYFLALFFIVEINYHN